MEDNIRSQALSFWMQVQYSAFSNVHRSGQPFHLVSGKRGSIRENERKKAKKS